MGYTLRKQSKESGVQMNIYLGNGYTFIHSEWAREEFERTLELREDWKAYDPDQFYAYVGNEDGSQIYPLFKAQFNYIMTDSGQTFANVTFK